MRLRRDKMAKKRKKDKKEEQEYEFKPPEFDEREFLKKELRDTRAAIISVGIAVVFGIVAGVVTALGSGLAGIAFIIGIGGIFSLKFIYNLMGIDISGFTRRNWAGTVVTYFFTFLAIWVLVINTPFADLTDPGVEDLTIWVDDGGTMTVIVYKKSNVTGVMTWMREDNDGSANGIIHAWNTTTINITARISDSGGISVAEITLNGTASEFTPMLKEQSGRYGYEFKGDLLAGRSSLAFIIHAKDKHGNENTVIPGTIDLA